MNPSSALLDSDVAPGRPRRSRHQRSPKVAIRAAHDVCFALDGGSDPVDLGVEIYESTDLTTDQAALFVVTSVDHYCPEFGVLFE